MDNKITITRSEYKKLKTLTKKANRLSSQLNSVYKEFKKTAKDERGGYSTDVIYNNMSMNWLLHGLGIKVKK